MPDELNAQDPLISLSESALRAIERGSTDLVAIHIVRGENCILHDKDQEVNVVTCHASPEFWGMVWQALDFKGRTDKDFEELAKMFHYVMGMRPKSQSVDDKDVSEE